jgi:hypothetical protein
MPSAQHLHSEEVADLLLKEWGRGRRMDEWLSTAVLLGTIWAIKIDRPLDKPTSARHFDAAVPSRLIAPAAKRHQDHLLEPRPVAQLGRTGSPCEERFRDRSGALLPQLLNWQC